MNSIGTSMHVKNRLLRLLEDSKKSKYSIRTVKPLQITLIKQSNIQVDRMITVKLSVQKPLKFTSLSICKSQGNMLHLTMLNTLEGLPPFNATETARISQHETIHLAIHTALYRLGP